MKDKKINKLRDVKDLSRSELFILSEKQARMFRKEYGVDTTNVKNSYVIQKALNPNIDAINESRKRIEYYTSILGVKNPPNLDDDS